MVPSVRRGEERRGEERKVDQRWHKRRKRMKDEIREVTYLPHQLTLRNKATMMIWMKMMIHRLMYVQSSLS